MRERVAIVGTGIAGMGCGHFLHPSCDLTFYEKNDYVGGHTHTVTIEEDGKPIPIDTGFMVFNHVTYPLLTRLFADLDVPTMPTSMSFSVQHRRSGLEFCGSGLNGLFAQRTNLFKPTYIKLLSQINQFNAQCLEVLSSDRFRDYSLREYVLEKGWSEDLLEKYLIPMSSAVWSTSPDRMAHFPAFTLVRFFYNHGFLGLNTQHPWYTVVKGSQTYRDKLIAPFRDRIFCRRGAVRVLREQNRAGVVDAAGLIEWYDRVILACHADEALRLLDQPTPLETQLLSPFRYQSNDVTLHTDSRLMPATRRAWSSWNVRIEDDSHGIPQSSTIYYMNSLQRVSPNKDYFVSINGRDLIDESTILAKMTYDHPIFTHETQRVQSDLPRLNEDNLINYCGSYFGYGFHEDALESAVDLSRQLHRESIAA